MERPARLPSGHALWRWLLPWRCLLCGARGADGIDLCADCAAELPRNRSCCARCALPLAAPAALCGECQRRAPPWDAAWAPFRYGWPLDRLESRYKFSADLAAGRVLSRLWQSEPCPLRLPQLLLAVPLHRSRLRRRGYNQALELARPLAHALGVPLHRDALQRRRSTAAQTELDAVARRRNVHGAFALREGVVLPAHVAILDDVMTTGATLAECARVLRRAGVQRVDVWALARAPSPRG
ncbi:ComF family protein [Rhodanobacter sp. KK11]|jgi:ComF family protein|uniref:ComF family protein n=1 Tax=Rhodanobacter sp. KK11 TaxID=3083255 RepID=UPI00296720B3|nr:ComF family protein [Rhodanobacter sp. KK11]MDW2979998.1 ComF family protein [Rhodanobacter sp. KK11]